MKFIVLILVILATVKVGNGLIHSINREGKRVDACLFNPSYQGANPDDTLMMYNQCRDDYDEAGFDK